MYPKFPPSVRHYALAHAFRRHLRCGRDVRWMLVRTMTPEAQLPQGAPTSTAAANFLLKHAVDQRGRQSYQTETKPVSFSAFASKVAVARQPNR